MIRTIIVDDETDCCDVLARKLNQLCPAVELIAVAHGVMEGIEKIATLQPHLVLLDIDMPDGTGFDLLKKFNTVNFKVIFVTAFHEYAIKAIRWCALDYLLKPVDNDELVQAIQKAQRSVEDDLLNVKLKQLIANTDAPRNENKRILLSTAESIHFVDIKDIIRCESDVNYTTFFLTGKQKILVSKPLKEFDELLSSDGFFRTHQSHLINIKHLVRYDKREGGYIVMSDSTQVPVSIRKKESLIQLMKK